MAHLIPSPKSYAGEDRSLLQHKNSSWADFAAFLGRVVGQ